MSAAGDRRGARTRRFGCWRCGLGVHRGVLCARRFAVLEVISTIMLNFVALHAVSYLVRGPLQEPTHVYPQSSTIVDAIHLPRITGAGRLHGGLLLALGVSVVAGWMLRRTAAGFRLIAAGESPSAATSAGGIDVMATTTLAFLVSGALAGLAGGVEVLGVTFALYENISPGYGYTAIAVALLAALDPWRVVATALLFGGLEAGAGAMQRDAGVPSTLVAVIEAALILAVSPCGALRRRSSMPDAAHIPDRRMTDVVEPFLAATIRTAVPLALAALGELLVERTGLINIGLEGAILAGAFGALVGASEPWRGTRLYERHGRRACSSALLFAAFVIWARADQIITGTALTLLSVGATGTLYRAIYGSSGAALSIPTSAALPIPGLAGLPVVGPALFSQPPITYFVYSSRPRWPGGWRARMRALRCAPSEIGLTRPRRQA